MVGQPIDDFKRWRLLSADPDRARELAEALGVQPLTAQLLLNRNITEPEHARRFLDPRLNDLRSPDGGRAGAALAMAGFQRASERLARAVTDGETIGVFGDYDVDGLTTCALLTRFLSDAGARVVSRVARRAAGYGFGIADADGFADAACTVIVTGDCGTSDYDALAHAKGRGADVIVVDHHQVPERDPGAFALLNPHQPECGFPFKGLASVGVAFYLAAAVRTLLRTLRPASALPDPRDLLDLVALGTICDMAPLTDENRVLVTAGLRELGRGRRPGVRALVALGGLDLASPISAFDVGFRLGPRLNAPGRLGDAQLALDLLLAPDAVSASAIAVACDEVNARRRVVQEQVFAEAMAQIEGLGAPMPRGIVVAGQGWAPGVVGIVAAKLVERFAVPAVVIALDGAVGRGSARTVGGCHLFRAFQSCAGRLVRFGGHAAAAGLTLEVAELAGFRRAFNDAVAAQIGETAERASLPVDAEVDLDHIDERVAEELSRLGPFGVGNPEPLLAARGLAVDRTRVVGVRHLQITLRGRLHRHDGIAFGLAGSDPGVGARVKVAFVPELDTFRGARRLRLRVREIHDDRIEP